MKFFIAALALVAVASAQQHQASPPVEILRQETNIAPEGSYQYSYETANGISAAESANLKPANNEEGAALFAQGSYQYSAPDGTPIALSYVADENGYQPQGAHLPVAPEIPEAIQRAIEYIRAHPQPEKPNRR